MADIMGTQTIDDGRTARHILDEGMANPTRKRFVGTPLPGDPVWHRADTAMATGGEIVEAWAAQA